MKGRIPQLVASHQDGYRRWHNPLLLISVINGGITNPYLYAMAGDYTVSIDGLLEAWDSTIFYGDDYPYHCGSSDNIIAVVDVGNTG